jgi:hypothetical protein
MLAQRDFGLWRAISSMRFGGAVLLTLKVEIKSLHKE